MTPVLSSDTFPVTCAFSFCHARTSFPFTTFISAYRSAHPSSRTAFGSDQIPFWYTEYFRTVLFRVLRLLSYAWNTSTFFPFISACIGRADGSTAYWRVSMVFCTALVFLVPPIQALVSSAKAVSISLKDSCGIWSVFPDFLFFVVSQSVVLYSASG